MLFYTDPAREQDLYALPDAETMFIDEPQSGTYESAMGDEYHLPAGWYWISCFPGCLPDAEPMGPFGSEQEAVDDARELVAA